MWAGFTTLVKGEGGRYLPATPVTCKTCHRLLESQKSKPARPSTRHHGLTPKLNVKVVLITIDRENIPITSRLIDENTSGTSSESGKESEKKK